MGHKCKKASLRAYRELRQCGRTAPAAFDAAVAVHRYHHPETAPRESGRIVSGWIEEWEATEPGFNVKGTA